ncbi:MAG TPA: ATP-dependent Clp protease proteolytic subunit [Verrucomicrobiae bacterium]|nr:ATP-dependent Clp protease proteolytic subunit [Verrucomicrobiae bacterium]
MSEPYWKNTLLDRRTLLLEGTLTEKGVAKLIDNLYQLASLESTEPITLFISSNGGSVSPGLALFDALRQVQEGGTKVEGHVLDECMSMALTVLLACDHRTAFPNSQFLYHSVCLDSLPGFVVGEIERNLDSYHERLKRHIDDVIQSQKRMMLMESARCGQTVETLESLCRYGDEQLTIFSDQALQHGFIHDIVSHHPKLLPKMSPPPANPA